MEGEYVMHLWDGHDDGAGIERTLCRRDDLSTARVLYRTAVMTFPAKLVTLQDRARVLASSDRSDTNDPRSSC